MALDSESVTEIVDLYQQGWEITPLAARYHVSVPSVWRVITGQTWAKVTGGQNISRSVNRKKLTRYRCAHIEGRIDQGCTNFSLIARELGISRQAVSKLVKAKGIGGNECSVE